MAAMVTATSTLTKSSANDNESNGDGRNPRAKWTVDIKKKLNDI